MKTILPEVEPELPPALRAAPKPTGDICHRAMGRLLSLPHEPLFFADWDRTLMLHYEVAPEVLRPHVPFPLDLHGGKAYVSLVAFKFRAGLRSTLSVAVDAYSWGAIGLRGALF